MAHWVVESWFGPPGMVVGGATWLDACEAFLAIEYDVVLPHAPVPGARRWHVTTLAGKPDGETITLATESRGEALLDLVSEHGLEAFPYEPAR